jgi:hypothetical protein
MEFIGQLNDKNLVEDFTDLKRWVEEDGKSKDFNGRQIRNVISTAMSLAHARDKKMVGKDISTVAKHIENFQKALANQETIYRSEQIITKKQ